RETGPTSSSLPRQEDGRKPTERGRQCVDAGGDDWGAAVAGVAEATRTVSPATIVSGGLLMIRSDGDMPAMTSTLSPRSRPSCTFLRTTLLSLSRVATCVP